MRGPAPYSGALPGDPLGLTMAQRGGGAFRIFAGTASGLYALDSSDLSWTAIGAGYHATDDDRWSFVQWGSQLLAANLQDDLQGFDIEAGVAAGPVAGSPPRARFIDVISDFVVLAGLSSDPFALQWSGIDDVESWTPGTDLSDIKEFKGGGRVMNISGAAGLVVLERALWQMIRSPGSGLAFEFQLVEAGKGTIAPFSVVKYGPAIGYLAEDGFWFDGEPIGQNKVNRHFLATVSQDRLFSVRGAIDPIATRFYWAYRTGESAAYDRALVYDWRLKRWSEIEIGATEFSSLATPGLTLEGVSALHPTLADVPYPLGSRVWQGGRPVFAMFGADRRLAFLEGPALAATVETAERELAPGRRATVTGARPLVGAAAATVAIGRRDRLADVRSWTAEAAMQPSGRCPVRAGGRYVRARIAVPAAESWSQIEGVDLEFAARGSR
ncbi:MAG: hypothetical protein KIS96_10885 [Bauldia sp.]|nr:hypothetical protein [Bauldia sp.]